MEQVETPLCDKISDREFSLFQQMIHKKVGIFLSPAKKALVAGRLMKRLRHYGFDSYRDYFDFATQGEGKQQGELERMIDLISTNETHFFREPHHFRFLKEEILPNWSAPADMPFWVWSAAASTGEEPYTLAITLEDHFSGKRSFEVLGTDINQTVLQAARTAVYPMSKVDEIPKQYLSRYFLKGVRSRTGTILVNNAIRQRVRFQRLNLNESLPRMPTFDVVFCRNVMIYFNQETKIQVVRRLLSVLKKGGYLFIGHAETLSSLTDSVEPVMSTVYRKL